MSSVENIAYEDLTRRQKLAIFLVMLGPEATSAILQQFDDAEAESICKDIAQFQVVDRNIQKRVMDDFESVIRQSQTALIGGQSFVKKVIDRVQRESRNSHWLSHMLPGKHGSDVVSTLNSMEPEQIFNLVANEQPQTLAFLLSSLSQEKATKVIEKLPDELCHQVMQRIGRMGETPKSHMHRMLGSLQSHIREDKVDMRDSGGVDATAQLLNLMNKDLRKSVLASIEEEDEELGAAIRKKMFSFEDLVNLQVSDLQRIAREVEMSDLTLALKNASERLKTAIFGSVSKRAAEGIREEMEMLGSVKLKEVEAAQDRIIQCVRLLEEQGEVSLDSGDDERVG